MRTYRQFNFKFLTVAAAALALVAVAPALHADELTRTDFVLGTVCTVRLVDGGTSATLNEAFTRLRAIEDHMSANREDSEISRVNDKAGKEPVQVSEDTFYVISKALKYAQLTNGAFDPTVGPLVKLWNIGNGGEKVPPEKDILQAKSLINWRDLVLDENSHRVFLKKPGMRIDLGAIAKGYAADELEKIMDADKVKAAIIDLGGNIFVYGSKHDKSPWRVGIQNPDSPRGDYLGIVTGAQMTVVTSGIYERFFFENGKRYHHILNTQTGFPVDNGLVSVSIVSKSSIDADALSTSLFILGIQKGMEFLRQFPDTYAVFIDKDKKVYLSQGASKVFTLLDKDYTLAEK